MNEFKIPGNLSLDEIADRIRNIEVARNQFVGCVVSGESNVVTFVQADVPPTPYLVLPGEAAPVPGNIMWVGKMRVSGKTVSVQLVRKHLAVATTDPQVDLSDAMSMKLLSAFSTAPLSDPATPVISRDDVFGRAYSAADTATIYRSPGSMPSLHAEAWPNEGAAIDCSGFVAWCLRMSRKVPHPLYRKVNGGWFETTALYRDGREPSGLFRPVSTADVGSLLVYPDRGGQQGHVGIVVEVDGEGINGVTQVIHCASGNFRRTGKAILLTDAGPWLQRADSIIIDYEGFVD